MEIPKLIKDEIWEYCRLNNITNIDEFTIKLVKQGFTIEKFGATPVAKEKIVEKIVEVPVDRIVEKIVEVPIEMVDSEISNSLKEYINLVEILKNDIINLNGINTTLKKELEEEKIKNKKDLYGEK
jgi:hypothetical protein